MAGSGPEGRDRTVTRYCGFPSRQTLRAALREREWLIISDMEFEGGRPSRSVLKDMARRRAASEYRKLMAQQAISTDKDG